MTDRQALDRLAGDEAGRYLVQTENSGYLFEASAGRRVATRLPTMGADADSVYYSELDHDPLIIAEIVRCVVGEPMHLMIRRSGAGDPMPLQTSPVVAIQREPERGAR